MEADAPFAIRGEDAIRENGVIMQVQVEAAAESLKVVERGGLASDDAGDALLLRRHGIDEDATDRGRDVGTERREAPQLEREREHIVANGDGGQNAIGDVGGGVAHPPRAAAGADAPALARERDEQIPTAVVAVKTQEAVREDAAPEIRAEGLLDVMR